MVARKIFGSLSTWPARSRHGPGPIFFQRQNLVQSGHGPRGRGSRPAIGISGKAARLELRRQTITGAWRQEEFDFAFGQRFGRGRWLVEQLALQRAEFPMLVLVEDERLPLVHVGVHQDQDPVRPL